MEIVNLDGKAKGYLRVDGGECFRFLDDTELYISTILWRGGYKSSNGDYLEQDDSDRPIERVKAKIVIED